MRNQIKVPNTIPKHSNQSSWVLKDHAATIQFGKYLAKSLSKKQIIFLDGPLGAGKTSLVKGIAEGLFIDEPITSPTFSLSHHYLKGKKVLIHLDLYRLEDPRAANELFIQEEENNNNFEGIMVIEWSSRLSLKINNELNIKMKYFSNGGRIISFEC